MRTFSVLLQTTQVQNSPAQRSGENLNGKKRPPRQIYVPPNPVHLRVTPSTRSVPAPTGRYAFLPTHQQSVVGVWFYGFDRFYLSPINLTTHETELESLNGYYAGLSATELMEDSPKVGLPCVVKFRDDNMFYRSQIVAIFPDKTARILLVDCGKEQVTPLTEIRRIVPKFMKIPLLVWPCKLAGIDGVDEGSGCPFPTVSDFMATFLSVDKGLHHVKMEHKIRGDLATCIMRYLLTDLRPAIVKLHESKCQLLPEGCDFVVSHVNSENEFWIQLKADEEIVNYVCEKLVSYMARKPSRVHNPVGGQLYAVLPNSGMYTGIYFRGRVSWKGNKLSAHLIDYGVTHSIAIAKVYVLLVRLEMLPPLAIRCWYKDQKIFCGSEIAEKNDASTVEIEASLPMVRNGIALKEEAMNTRINPIMNQEELTMISAFFVGCTSPNAIYLRTPELAERFTKLHHVLQRYFQVQQISLKEASVNLFVGFIGALQYGDQWFRVKVVNVDKYPDISVLLFDIALSLNVNAGEIHHLPDGWKTFPKTLLCFSLSGIRSSSGTAWGPKATHYVSAQLTGAERIIVRYRKDAEGLSTENAIPVAVYVHEKSRPNLDPGVTVDIDMSQELVALGLAASTDHCQ